MEIIREGNTLQAIGLITPADRTKVVDQLEAWGMGVWSEPVSNERIHNAILIAVDSDDEAEARGFGRDIAELGITWIGLDAIGYWIAHIVKQG